MAVVGGGIVGSSLAYDLVKAGATVALVDRHDRSRATDAGAGILSPETGWEADPLRYAFAEAAAAHYEELARRLAEDAAGDCGFSVTGSLLVAQRPGDDPVMDQLLALAAGRSPGALEEIDPADAVSRFPPLTSPRRAVLNRAARRVDGRVLNAALRRGALRHGLEMIDSGVTGLGVDRSRSLVVGVETRGGSVPAGTVVLAAGAWTASLVAPLGVELPVSPLKGQIVHLAMPSTDTATWPIVQPVLGFYLVPWPDGRVVCGGTMEADAGFDERPTADGLHQLLREALLVAPGLSEASVVETRGRVAAGHAGRASCARSGSRVVEPGGRHRARDRRVAARSLFGLGRGVGAPRTGNQPTGRARAVDRRRARAVLTRKVRRLNEPLVRHRVPGPGDRSAPGASRAVRSPRRC